MLDFRGLVHKALEALDQERPADAEKSLRAALGVSPRDDQLLHLLGVALVRQQREEEAVEPLQKAISLNRRDPEYHNALGCALRNTGRVAEGIESLQRALKLAPDLQDAHFNLGQAYVRMGETALAEEKFRRILAVSPGDIEAINALSNLRWFMGDFEDSIAILRAAIARLPGSGDLRFMLGEQLLTLGRFEEGWLRYLWRVNRFVALRKFGLGIDSKAAMALLPGSLEGITVKLHAEQGIGDDLFFLRFVAFLRGRGARISGTITPRLVEMVRRSGVLDEVDAAPERSPPSPDFRLLGDLPYLLQAHAMPVPASLRFAPLPERMVAVSEMLRGLPRPLVGLTWRAGTGPEAGNRNALYKEVPFGKFVSMAAGIPGTLLVLQRAPKPGEVQQLEQASGQRVVDFAALNGELESMLALLAQIDDYVGVSNTNMHLCAALGRTARVLVSRGAEFRWMAAGDSPWFPGFGVFRQGEKGDWSEAMRGIAVALVAS